MSTWFNVRVTMPAHLLYIVPSYVVSYNKYQVSKYLPMGKQLIAEEKVGVCCVCVCVCVCIASSIGNCMYCVRENKTLPTVNDCSLQAVLYVRKCLSMYGYSCMKEETSG